MENLKYDCLRLINRILSDTFEDFVIVHLAQSEFEVFSYPGSPEIPTAYGYVIDRTPQYLEREGVLKILYNGNFVISDYFNRLATTPTQKQFHDILVTVLQRSYREFTGSVWDFSLYSITTPTQKNIAPNGARGLVYVVIDRKKATNWKEKTLNEASQTISSQQQRPFWYENRQLFFKLANGSVESLDFSKAEQSRKIFEAFFYLSSDGVGKYTSDKIALKYKQLHKGELEVSRIGELVSNVRDKIVKPKVSISDRIEWKFDKSSGEWIFKLA